MISNCFHKTKRPIVVSGPCSAESREQLFSTIDAIKDYVDAVRVGIWKPRTNPYSFQGIGEEGLEWISEIKKRHNLKIATEVANAEHIELALKNGIDILWIGARSTTNPFLVQEIAEALKGVDTTILIKNPINPDLELWCGAIERVLLAGVKRVGAIHRGFSYYGKGKYRNMPQWQLPIDLKQRYPAITLLCDPSHLSGDKQYVTELSQKAMLLGFDGLFIESHISPETAKSDANQQITPAELKKLIDNLKVDYSTSTDSSYSIKLEELRSQIDGIDNALIELLSQRMEIVKEIGELKKINNSSILQRERWGKVLENAIKSGQELGLDSDFVSNLFKLIHQASIEKQTKDF